MLKRFLSLSLYRSFSPWLAPFSWWHLSIMVINVDTRQMLAKEKCKLSPCPFPLCLERGSQKTFYPCMLRRGEALVGLKRVGQAKQQWGRCDPYKLQLVRTSLVLQWLKLYAPDPGDMGSIPSQGTRSHMPQLKVPCAATKTWRSQINIKTTTTNYSLSCAWEDQTPP